MRTFTTRIKLKFYGIRLNNSKFEKIHNNTYELERHLDHLLHEFKIKTFFESIAEKIILLENIVTFTEYER